MLYHKFSIQSSFWRGWNSLQLIFSPQVQNMHSSKDRNFYIIGPFEKSTKTPFWVKASYMSMEDPIEMKPKGLIRGNPNIYKKFKNPLLGSKLREICIVKVGNFWKIVKSQHWSNLHFFQRGPCFLVWNMFLIGPTTPELFHLLFYYFYHLFWFFIHLNQNKSN